MPWILVITALAAILGGCSHPPARAVREPLVILGFDGADPDLLQRWTSEGKLPNIQRLAQSGTVQSLGTTDPPESPVAWASFATGLNPGKHGIFDFLEVDRARYLPDIGLVDVEKPRFLLRTLPIRGARITNHRKGTPFYKTVADQGITTSILRMPLAFPPEELPAGRVLSGLGVPDIRQTWGTFFYFATDLTQWDVSSTEFGGVLVRLERKGTRMQTRIEGPFDPRHDDFRRLSIPLELELTPDERALKIRVQGREQTVPEGGWSDWFDLRFRGGMFVKAHGISRFLVLETYPEVRLYLEPIGPDPRDPPFAISSPPEFAAELAGRIGLFKTVGWVHETWGLNEEKLDEKAFLVDLFRSMESLEAAVLDQLNRERPGLLVAVFTATDSVSHMFYRLLDPEHPRHDAALAAEFGDSILKVYQKMDSIIGRVLGQLAGQGTLLVVSDHGFHSWRKEFNTNTWLAENGFLAFKTVEAGAAPASTGGSFFPNVDWSRTKAYSLGLAGILVNLKDREGQGAVSAGSEYDRVRQEIIGKLLQYRDPDTAGPVLKAVYKREDLYQGPEIDKAPDLQLAFHSGYRTSWQTSLGGIPEGIVVANLKKWSGDHCSSDRSETAGILLSNRKVSGGGYSLVDIAPTVLQVLGLAGTTETDGRAITFVP